MKSALTACNTNNWNRCFIHPTTTKPFSISLTNTNFRTRCSISMANAIKTYHLSNLTHTELLSLKSRPRIDFTSIFNVVSFLPFSPNWGFLFHSKNPSFLSFQVNPIVDDVHNQGDAAVKQLIVLFHLSLIMFYPCSCLLFPF